MKNEMMAGAMYDPPYDSPIEDKFAYNFVKYAALDCSLVNQHPVETICGKFIIDFVIVSNNGKHIGVECDGKDFHDASRDEWRDAMIIGDGHLDVIYRIKGEDITYQIENVLYLMANIDQTAFSDRALINLKILTSANSTKRSENFNQNMPSVVVEIDDSNNLHCVLLDRRTKEISPGRRQFWMAAYKFASSIGGGDLDEVIMKYRNKV